MDIRLITQDLTVHYGARTVFAHISLELRGGEVLVVSGSNGSGKSTFLRLLAGLQQPTAGQAYYQYGQQAIAPRDAAAYLGWVAPDLALYRELSARENLRFFASVRQLERSDQQLDALLARVGLGGRGDDRLSAYSSGMVQRMRYAYALIHEPPILLLDEPTVTLDTKGTEVVAEIIAAQRRQGIVVIATNDPRELAYGDLILRFGVEATAESAS